MTRPKPGRKTLLLIVSVVSLMLSFTTLEPADRPDSNRFLAERIAASGHGLLLDENGREIRMSAASINAMQAAILAEVSKARPERVSGEAGAALERARRLLPRSTLPQVGSSRPRGDPSSRLMLARMRAEEQNEEQEGFRNAALHGWISI